MDEYLSDRPTTTVPRTDGHTDCLLEQPGTTNTPALMMLSIVTSSREQGYVMTRNQLDVTYGIQMAIFFLYFYPAIFCHKQLF